MTSPLKTYALKFLTKGLLLDLEDGLRAAGRKAFAVIHDHTTLNRKRAREAEGQIRFRMMEQEFEQLCSTHGGRLLEGGIVPQTDLQVFQPFMRFTVGGRGIILGLATMPEPKAVPAKNKSRLAAVRLNYHLSPRLDLDGHGPKIDDIFVLFLVARDREKAGQLQEVAIGIVDSSYQSFLFYERLDEFLSGFADEAPKDPIVPLTPSAPAVTLKKIHTPFIPNEVQSEEHGRDDSSDKGSGA